MIITIMEKMPNRFVPDIELAQRSRPSIVKIVVIHLTGCTLQDAPYRMHLTEYSLQKGPNVVSHYKIQDI